MRASAAEYRSLHLRALLVTFHFMTCRQWIFREAAAGGPSRILLGRVFGWDREPMLPEDSFLEHLSQRDRCDSEITPGTLVGHFLVLYQFPGEALRETRNKTVHGFICTALVSSPNEYILYWGDTSTRVVAYATVPRCDRTISPGSVSSNALPHSSRVDCCLRRHEPERYCRL